MNIHDFFELCRWVQIEQGGDEMTIIDKFQSITHCGDCCKTEFHETGPDEWTLWCTKEHPCGERSSDDRCDSGLWLARGALRDAFYPVTLERYVCACRDGYGDHVEILPRAEWPEAAE